MILYKVHLNKTTLKDKIMKIIILRKCNLAIEVSKRLPPVFSFIQLQIKYYLNSNISWKYIILHYIKKFLRL